MEIVNIIVSGVISIMATLGVQLLFFRQTRRRMQVENQAGELENKSKQAEEWRKLYEEEQGKNDDKDKLISQLYKKIDEERQKRAGAELQLAVCRGKMGFLSVIKCKRFECGNRIPPYEEIAKLAEAENEEF